MDLIKPENVQICEGASDWRDAIRIAASPLEQHGYMERRYIDGMIANVEKLGPYIVIAENVALPHARPEQGAIETQVGVTLFRQDIAFEGRGVTARLFITLAAKDSDSHLGVLSQISELLDREGNVEKILASENKEVLYQHFV